MKSLATAHPSGAPEFTPGFYTTGATSGAGTANPSGALEFTPVLSGVRVTRSLVLYVCYVDRCLYFCTFSFGHCVVCSSSVRNN
jgi:hypothetical protein